MFTSEKWGKYAAQQAAVTAFFSRWEASGHLTWMTERWPGYIFSDYITSSDKSRIERAVPLRGDGGGVA